MSNEQAVRDAIMAAMKKAGVQGLMRATVFAHLRLPARDSKPPMSEEKEALFQATVAFMTMRITLGQFDEEYQKFVRASEIRRLRGEKI